MTSQPHQRSWLRSLWSRRRFALRPATHKSSSPNHWGVSWMSRLPPHSTPITAVFQSPNQQVRCSKMTKCNCFEKVLPLKWSTYSYLLVGSIWMGNLLYKARHVTCRIKQSFVFQTVLQWKPSSFSSSLYLFSLPYSQGKLLESLNLNETRDPIVIHCDFKCRTTQV